ncbi:unnamed protein product [Symbiodinium microadriaticum]|nr:unnamed protein product [Symbiodinium microadriaticum]
MERMSRISAPQPASPRMSPVSDRANVRTADTLCGRCRVSICSLPSQPKCCWNGRRQRWTMSHSSSQSASRISTCRSPTCIASSPPGVWSRRTSKSSSTRTGSGWPLTSRLGSC